jgi:PKD repeat protein
MKATILEIDVRYSLNIIDWLTFTVFSGGKRFMLLHIGRLIYKVILILTALALMLPAPVFAAQAEPPALPEVVIGLGVINDSPTELGSSTNFTAMAGGFTPITYTWNFGDGSPEIAGLASMTAYGYTAAGFYTAIVTATDGGINTISATTPVTITAPCTSGLVVENTNDSDCGSLRYAVGIAQPGDTVTFTPTLASQPITLTTGQIDIDKSITIDGSGAPNVAVSGNDASRIFEIWSQGDITVTLRALSIIHGLSGWGGGVRNYASLNIINSRFANNVAVPMDGPSYGGGLANYGVTTIYDSVFVSNTADYGGGVYNSGLFSSFSSTFSGNEAVYEGGGLYNVGNQPTRAHSGPDDQPYRPTAIGMEIVNTTLSGNRTADVEIGAGGGIYNAGPLSILNSTFYNNVAVGGGGLFNQQGADLSFANTVIAYSAGGDCVDNGNLTSNVNNLVEDESCSADFSGDPLLDALANNGGPTLTHLPLTDSPLIDTGDNASAAELAYDQRGPGFPRVVSGTVDIGAVEVAAEPPILTAINDSPTLFGTATNLTATLTGVMPSPLFSWDFGDALAGAGQTVAHTYGAVGLYTATVTAANGVVTVTATTLVTITEPPLLNLVAINNSPTPLGNTTNFLASVLGNSATFTWAFGDGTTGAGQSPSHVYGAVGFYIALVTATNSVSTLTTTTRVTITQPPVQHYTLYLPLVMRDSFTAPELIVQSVAASSNVITVVIKNIGDAPAYEAFWVDAYVDPNPPPTAVNHIWYDGRSQQGVAWAIDELLLPLEPGAVITLTSRDANVSPDRTFFPGNLPVGTPIYAQVDSLNYATNYGAVRERQEILGLPYNNILGPVSSIAGTTSLAEVLNRLIADRLKSTLPYRPTRP